MWRAPKPAASRKDFCAMAPHVIRGSVRKALTLAMLASVAIGLPAHPPHQSSAATGISPVTIQSEPLRVSSEVSATRNRAKPANRPWRVQVHGWRKTFKRGGQGRIDRCKATLWWGSMPRSDRQPAWLAGHNTCGFWRWDKWLPVGAEFKVFTPRGRVWTYRVYERGFVNRRSGPSTGLIRGDLTLQTCRGSGMTFAYARRVSNRVGRR
ncbi:MAG: hypothetical protein ACRCYU_17335 [Nocardioides sp.]